MATPEPSELELLREQLRVANEEKLELQARAVALCYLTPGETIVGSVHAVYEQFKKWRDALEDGPVLKEPLGPYRVELVDPHAGCPTCQFGASWQIVRGKDADKVVVMSWGDQELTRDICDLMNDAYMACLEDLGKRNGTVE